MIPFAPASLAARVLQDLLEGLAGGVIAAHARIAEAAGTTTAALLGEEEAPAPRQKRAKAAPPPATALATIDREVPADIAPRYHAAYSEGYLARSKDVERDANPTTCNRGIAGARRIAWFRGWDDRDAAVRLGVA